jgi:hypothetical protein
MWSSDAGPLALLPRLGISPAGTDGSIDGKFLPVNSEYTNIFLRLFSYEMYGASVD